MARKTFMCHKGVDTVAGESIFTKGDIYEIKDETKNNYILIDDSGSEQPFTKEKDRHGDSYKTWFV